MEQLGLFVLVALFWVVQFIVRTLRGRHGTPPGPVLMPTPPPPRRQGRVPDDEELFVRARLPAPRSEPPPVAGPSRARVVGHVPRRRPALGTRRELRRAIVLREVLGPCRGMESSAQ
jgi:hypothetical protein